MLIRQVWGYWRIWISVIHFLGWCFILLDPNIVIVMHSHLLILQSVNSFFLFVCLFEWGQYSSQVCWVHDCLRYFLNDHMRSAANISEAEVTSDGNSSFYTLQTDGWGDVPFTGKICSVTDACQLPFPALLRDFIELTRLRNCWNWFLLLNTADLILQMQGGLCLRWCKAGATPVKSQWSWTTSHQPQRCLEEAFLKWKHRH